MSNNPRPGLAVNARSPSKPRPRLMGHDGPYVLRRDGQWVTMTVRHHVTVTARPLAPHEDVAVEAIGEIPGFTVSLRDTPAPTVDTLPLAEETPLIVVADTHGEYEILIALLRAHGVIDAQHRWAFGAGQAVFIGDMFDRGRHQMEVIWLLYKLEAEAARAGGALHILLGNHDMMVMRGDLRYLHLKYGLTADALEAASYSGLVGPDSLLGTWLRAKPAMLKLGDLLFVHGGVSQKLVDSGLDLSAINVGIRRALDVPEAQSAELDEQTKLLIGPDGPLWYRGYFATGGGAPAEADLRGRLGHFGAHQVLVGHTPVKQVAALHGGCVIAAHVYPRRSREGTPIMEAALRLGGGWYRIDAQGYREPLSLVEESQQAQSYTPRSNRE